MKGTKLPPTLFAEGVDKTPWKGFTGDDKRKGYGFVYFFAECSKHGIPMGNVKIGYTNSVTKRYKDVQHYNGNKIKVYGHWRGEEDTMKRFETTAHWIADDFYKNWQKHYIKRWKHGEWFHFKNTSDILDVVKEINDNYERI